jgi:hypothetical protein
MLVALKTFDLGDEHVTRGQQVLGLAPRMTARLINTRHVRVVEEKQPMQLVVTDRPRREGRAGFDWFGKWYDPGDVWPEDDLTERKRRILVNTEWVREEPIPQPKKARKKTTAKRKTPKRKRTRKWRRPSPR